MDYIVLYGNGCSHMKGENCMEQYIEHIRQKIIEAVTETDDQKMLYYVYGLLMSNLQDESPST